MPKPLKNIADVVEHRLCMGCGACAAVCAQLAVRLYNFTDEGIRPVVDASRCIACGTCLSVCPGHTLGEPSAGGDGSDPPQPDPLAELRDEWGVVLEAWEGWAADEAIRFRGSSGGAATALGVYALERGGMAGVLHVGMDPDRPYLNEVVLSRSTEEVAARGGSRYAPAAVCGELSAVENAPGPCMLNAKPCEIAAALRAAELRPALREKLGLTVAIFCGGTPSTRGTLEVLARLGIDDPRQVAALRYRGCGWPGRTEAQLFSGEGERRGMTYHEAWDEILTKHKPPRCLACPDGTGRFADLVCGDPWYRTPQPDEPGSSLILVRTERGRQALADAMRLGYLVAERRPADVLPRSQHGLQMRHAHVWPKLAALRWVFPPAPRFVGFSLFRAWWKLPLGRRLVSLWRALGFARWQRKKGLLQLDPRNGEPIVAGRQEISRTDGATGAADSSEETKEPRCV